MTSEWTRQFWVWLQFLHEFPDLHRWGSNPSLHTRNDDTSPESTNSSHLAHVSASRGDADGDTTVDPGDDFVLRIDIDFGLLLLGLVLLLMIADVIAAADIVDGEVDGDIKVDVVDVDVDVDGGVAVARLMVAA